MRCFTVNRGYHVCQVNKSDKFARVIKIFGITIIRVVSKLVKRLLRLILN